MAKKSIKQRAAPRPKAAAKMTVNVVVAAFSKAGTVLYRKRAAAPLKGRMELPFAAVGAGQTMVKAAQDALRQENITPPAVGAFRMVGAYQPNGASMPKNTIWIMYAVPVATAFEDGGLWHPIAELKKTALAFGQSQMLNDAVLKMHAAAKAAKAAAPADTADEVAPASPAEPTTKLSIGDPGSFRATFEKPDETTAPTPAPKKRSKAPPLLEVHAMSPQEFDMTFKGYTVPQLRHFLVRTGRYVKADVSKLNRGPLLDKIRFAARQAAGLADGSLVEEDSIPAPNLKGKGLKRLGTGLEDITVKPQPVEKIVTPVAASPEVQSPSTYKLPLTTAPSDLAAMSRESVIEGMSEWTSHEIRSYASRNGVATMAGMRHLNRPQTIELIWNHFQKTVTATPAPSKAIETRPTPNRDHPSLQAMFVKQGEEALRSYLSGQSRSHMESAIANQRLSGLTAEQLRGAPSDAEAVNMIVAAVKKTWEDRKAAGS